MMRPATCLLLACALAGCCYHHIDRTGEVRDWSFAYTERTTTDAKTGNVIHERGPAPDTSVVILQAFTFCGWLATGEYIPMVGATLTKGITTGCSAAADLIRTPATVADNLTTSTLSGQSSPAERTH